MSAGTKPPPTRVYRPVVARPLPVSAIPRNQLEAGWPPLWWVGCHGGAGASTLAKATGLGADAGAAWPMREQEWPISIVVLVCRATASGTWAATGAVEQWKQRGCPPGTRLLGVVAVDGSNRRPPRVAQERLQLLGGWVPNLWRVGWVETYLAADDPRDIGMPPDVAALRSAVGRLIGETVQ